MDQSSPGIGPQEDSLFTDLSVSYDGGNALGEACRWTRFLSILGMVILVIILGALIVAGSFFTNALSSYFPGLNNAFLGGAIIAVFLVIAAVGGVLIFLLYRFSTLMRLALRAQSQEAFNKALAALKVYFIISGVFGILSLLSNFMQMFK